MWQFGRGKPRLGGLYVAVTEELSIAVVKGAAKKAVATRVRRSLRLKAPSPKAAGARGGME